MEPLEMGMGGGWDEPEPEPKPSLVTIVQEAGEHTVFAAGAFDRCVGQLVTFAAEGMPVGLMRVTEAEVAPDGSSVAITFEAVEGE